MAKKIGATTEDTSQASEAQIQKEKSAKLTALQTEVKKLEEKAALEESKLQELTQSRQK